MLSTPCKPCVFNDPDSPRCRVGQYAISTEMGPMAPGFCRLHRQVDDKVRGKVLMQALRIVRQESEFSFDLVVLFDEERHTEDELRKSVTQCYGFQRKIIVVDTTGPTRTDKARRVMAEIDNPCGIHTDVLVERVDNWQAALDYSSRLVTAPYFMVCEAGRVFQGIRELGLHLACADNRVVRWSFPAKNEATLMVARHSLNGLWITQAFRLLEGSRGRSIFDKLAEYEQATGWSLSWFFDRVVIA